jgi:hypothetical protein
MYRLTTSPILVRFLLWATAALLTVSAFLFWGGGWAQLLEYINDIF